MPDVVDNDTCPDSLYGHTWVAGMMYVHSEDVHATAIARARFGGVIECERCEHVYQVGRS